MPSLSVSCYAMSVDIREACSFLEGNGGAVDLGKRGGGGGGTERSRGRESCSQVVL